MTQGPSLNIDRGAEAEAPSIDFAGAGRTVPWDAWYEPSAPLGGENQIFASRFVAAANQWQPEGQDRGAGIPSLNINTDKEAENPSVAGGAAVAGADPVPWVAWEEEDGNVAGSGNHDQIFVSKGVKQAAPKQPCTGFKPSDAASVSAFCWQQVGVDRLAEGRRLVADRRSDAEHRSEPQRRRAGHRLHRPGRHRGVDRLVREGPQRPRPARQRAGLRRADRRGRRRRTAASAGAPSAAAHRGPGQPPRHRGRERVRRLRRVDRGRGRLLAQQGRDQDAEDPRVAAGTTTPGAADRAVGRLLGGRRRPSRDHRSAAWSAATTSSWPTAATRSRPPDWTTSQPDITFFGNTPYVSWTATVGGEIRGFVGHLDAAGRVRQRHAVRHRAGPAPPGVADRLPRAAVVELHRRSVHGRRRHLRRRPTCNSPFFTFTTAGSPQRLFAQAAIGGPNCVIFARCHVDVHDPAQARADRRVPASAPRAWASSCSACTGTTSSGSGSVPLGTHGKGRLRLRWNLRVNGKPLHPGRYRITLRALDEHKRVLGLSTPTTIRIRR